MYKNYKPKNTGNGENRNGHDTATIFPLYGHDTATMSKAAIF